MTLHCFYHGSDLDGHCSGALIKHRYPEAILHPINYGEPFPWDAVKPEDTVYMVDFSLQPFHDMMVLCGEKGRLIWIDHHQSALKDWEYEKEFWEGRGQTVDIEGKREIGKAACELTWEYLWPDKPVPDNVRLLSLYDTWARDDKRFKWDEHIEPFQYGIKLEETDPSKNWDFWKWYFFVLDWRDVIEYGKAIMKYLKCRYETELASRGFKLSWEGHACLAINSDPYIANYMTRSKAFEGCDLAVNFCWGGKFWIVNLRSDEVDCSALAKRHGGGGHKGAAGFTCQELPFEVVA